MFLAFQSHAWHTDDTTGHTISGDEPHAAPGTEPARIVAALVDPAGPLPRRRPSP
jgi:hypothetical protein